MKIAWHMPTLQSCTCGLSRRAVEFARRLIQAGHHVRFYVDETKTDVRGGDIEGVPVERIAGRQIRTIHWSLQARSRRTRAAASVDLIPREYDLFVSCQPEAVDAHASLGCGQPTVFVCGGTTLLHDAADSSEQSTKNLLRSPAYRVDRWLKHSNERRAFNMADAVVFDSRHTRERVVSEYGVPPEKCHSIYGGVDAARFSPVDDEARARARSALGVTTDAFVVAWTGRLSAEKNLPLLLSAISASRRRPDCVWLVGDGPERTRLESMVAKLGIVDSVQFAGAQKDVRPYLYAADVFAFPSRGESFGGSLAEAMACGLACVAVRPDGGEARNASIEALDGGQCGIIVPNEPEEFASAIDRLHSDIELRREMGELARGRAEAHFIWDRAGIELEGLLTRIVGDWSKESAMAGRVEGKSIAQKLPRFSEVPS